MIITCLALEQFKSYESATIPLVEGANAIIGANGAGKSTLLEALGFVLFDTMPTGFTLANLLREGAKLGSAVVRIISSLDEREYEVERQFTATTTTRYRVYDLELGRAVLAEGRDDVSAWLHDHLRLEPTAKLSDLFDNTIGVPQGTFTAPFLQPANARKSIFEPLLQVDDYRKARDGLRETATHLSGQLYNLAEGIARAEGQLIALAGLERELRALETSLAELAERLVTLDVQVRGAEATLTLLDAAERRLSETRQRLAQARTVRTSQERRLDDARRALATAEQARAALESVEPAHAAFVAAEERLRELDRARAARDDIRSRRGQLEIQQATHSAQLAQAQQKLEEMATAEREMADLAPHVAEQAALEEALRQAEVDRAHLENARKHAQDVVQQHEVALQELAATRDALMRAQAFEREMADLQAQAAAQRQGALEARERAAAIQGETDRMQEQCALIERTEEGARCPTCEAELTPMHRAELLDRNRARLRELDLDLARLREVITASEGQVVEGEARAKRLQQERRRLPGETELRNAEQRVEQFISTLAAVRAEVARLEPALERVAECVNTLGALGNPRQRYAVCAAQLAQRPATASRAQELTRALANGDAQLTDLAHLLQPYAELDAQLAATQAERQRQQAGHNAYLANQREAAQVAARQTAVAELASDLERLAAEEAELTRSEEAQRAGYDADAHRLARQGATQARADAAAAGAQRAEQQARWAQAQEQLDALRQTAAELERLHARRTDTLRLQRRVQWVRDLLGQAGPYVTQQLVRRISQEASALYADIMGDHSGHLTWAEDYELSLDVRGRKRLFRQLSGGEQMCAALALRLALLHEMSAIDVAFFDEPTTNLDAERREGLAERIMQVKGFRQLFVISHDDAFERAAQNFLHVIKDEHGSRVEEGQLC